MVLQGRGGGGIGPDADVLQVVLQIVLQVVLQVVLQRTLVAGIGTLTPNFTSTLLSPPLTALPSPPFPPQREEHWRQPECSPRRDPAAILVRWTHHDLPCGRSAARRQRGRRERLRLCCGRCCCGRRRLGPQPVHPRMQRLKPGGGRLQGTDVELRAWAGGGTGGTVSPHFHSRFTPCVAGGRDTLSGLPFFLLFVAITS